MIRRVLKWAAGLYGLTLIALGGWVLACPVPPAESFAPADVIMVFAGGTTPDDRLDEPTLKRVARGVALYQAGRAPQIHFSGGAERPDVPGSGDQMARAAIAAGVPQAAITTENLSRSTLQNALFSRPDLENADSIILVSEAFHLPRIAASMAWAGGPETTQLAASTRWRDSALSTAAMFLREAAAWWFNIARVAVYGLAGLAGVDQDMREGWLV